MSGLELQVFSQLGAQEEKVRKVIKSWQVGMLPTYTVIVTGPNSAFMDFVFLPHLVGLEAIVKVMCSAGLRSFHCFTFRADWH